MALAGTAGPFARFAAQRVKLVGNTLSSAANAAYLREPLTQSHKADGGSETILDFPPGDPPSAYRQAAQLTFAGLPKFDGWPKVVMDPQQWSLFSRRRRRLVVKEVNPFMCAWPGAEFRPRVIFLLRHPAAIALSFRRLRWVSAEPEYWVRLGQRFGAALKAAYQSLKDMPDARVIVYETICAEPLSQFTDLFGYAGLQWSAEIETLVRQRTSTHDDPNSTSLVKISSKHTDSWRDEITPTELAKLRVGFSEHVLPWYQAPGDW